MEQMWLRCSIGPGQFPTEYAVAGVQHNGKSFSLFAPKETVDAPSAGEGAGYVRVDLVEKKGELALVRLPAQTFENGQFVTVKLTELQPTPAQRKGA
jgi:hypothetical protein